MSRRRFFVPEIRRGMAELTGSDAEHLVRVLRAEAGQVYEISDNQDLYLAEIEIARKSIVSFRVLEKLDAPSRAVAISLAAALIKFDRFEWVVEKATELGVSAIQPFEATRTERGLADASRKRHARWERIALEAGQQSRRVHLPEIHPTVRFEKALQPEATIKLFLDEEPSAQSILSVLPADRSAADRVVLMLGPEGGWTSEERQLAISSGWIPCSLGQTILRAETAAVAGLAIVQAAWAAVRIPQLA
jgi:16S rRNA (uracil1498-N3)-methyltransferase